MISARIKLAVELDSLVEKNLAHVIETKQAITVSDLTAKNAKLLCDVLSGTGWDLAVEDDAGELVADVSHLDHNIEDLGPFRIVIDKSAKARRRTIITAEGLRQALKEADAAGEWEVALCKTSFSTGIIQLSPLGYGDIFHESAPLKSPLEIVRESNETRRTPSDIRRWLVREKLDEKIKEDASFRIFCRSAAPALIRSISSECIGANKISFYGPPLFSQNISDESFFDELGDTGFYNLHSAAKWIYEDPAATEQRHALYSSEFGRSAPRVEKISAVLKDTGSSILQGARLAYQLSLSDLGLEACLAGTITIAV